MSETLTPAGAAWARAKRDRISGIALYGRAQGWPVAYQDAAIRIANEQAAEEAAERIVR